MSLWLIFVFFFQAEDGIRDIGVTGVQTCALPISIREASNRKAFVRKAKEQAGVAVEVLSREQEARYGHLAAVNSTDRKSVVEGKSVDLGGRRIIKKNKEHDVRVPKFVGLLDL